MREQDARTTMRSRDFVQTAIPNSLLPPQQVNPEISDAVSQAILTGMALQLENRPQSVQEWLRLFGLDPQLIQRVRDLAFAFSYYLT